MPDVNVLVAALHQQVPHHVRARKAIEAAFNGRAPVGLAWVAMTGFVRISTRRGIFERPLDVEQALQAVDHWVSHPSAVIVNPGPRHQGLLSRLLLAAGAAGHLTTDAHLAAMAIEHNAVLASFDRDFERFAGLRFERLTP